MMAELKAGRSVTVAVPPGSTVCTASGVTDTVSKTCAGSAGMHGSRSPSAAAALENTRCAMKPGSRTTCSVSAQRSPTSPPMRVHGLSESRGMVHAGAVAGRASVAASMISCDTAFSRTSTCVRLAKATGTGHVGITA